MPPRRSLSPRARPVRAALALLVPLVLAEPLGAQQAREAGDRAVGCTLSPDLLTAPLTTPTRRTPTDSARADTARTSRAAAMGADVVVYAAASARSIRFARQPEIRVRLCGGLDSVRVLERRNLERPVVAGRTYQNVYVAVEILGHVDGACLVDRLLQGAAAPAAARPDSAAAAGQGCAGVEVRGRSARAPGGAP